MYTVWFLDYKLYIFSITDVDLHFNFEIQSYVWHSGHEQLAIGYYTVLIFFESAVELIDLNLGSGGIKRFNVMSRQCFII